MITTSESPDSFKYPSTGQGLDGVVRVSANGQYGTGSLLYSGNTILTAAHILLDSNGKATTTASVYFETSTGKRTLTANQYIIHPNYDPSSGNFDIALLLLPDAAPSSADRYQLYREGQETIQIATLVGYGRQGTGDLGYNNNDEKIRTQAQNKLEMNVGALENSLGYNISWQPDPSRFLIADFDSGLDANDTLGSITDNKDLGTGIYEGLIAQGDSGGPALINQQLAGVANYITRFPSLSTDIDQVLNSSYGELGFWQKVSEFQDWIDLSIRAQYNTQSMMNSQTGKPDTSQIPLSVNEGENGTTQVFFLLEFHGLRSDAGILSVYYQTKDGSAIAGEDYIGVSGTLNLYENESYAWIPVEVIGDGKVEEDEQFYLTITHPVGGSFSNGQAELIATRTIVNDDWI